MTHVDVDNVLAFDLLGSLRNASELDSAHRLLLTAECPTRFETHVVDQNLQMTVLFHVLLDDSFTVGILHQVPGDTKTLPALGFDLLLNLLRAEFQEGTYLISAFGAKQGVNMTGKVRTRPPPRRGKRW